MIRNSLFKFGFFVFLLFLTGCNRYSVETYHDEFRKKQACLLKDHLLKYETSLFSGGTRLELNLDKENDNLILAHFALRGFNKTAFFKENTSIIFKATKEDNSIEEIKLTASNPLQNKTETKTTYTYTKYANIPSTATNSISIASTTMTRDQIIKIAFAVKVVFSVETLDHPITGELSQEDLQPFREFVDTCLTQK